MAIMPCLVNRTCSARSVMRDPLRRSTVRNRAAWPGRTSGNPRSARSASSSPASARRASSSWRIRAAMSPDILAAARGMVNQVDHRRWLAWPVMTIDIREAEPDDYAEAGRVTALAYREFGPADDDGDWTRYLARMADVAERADRTHILIAVEDGRI